MKENGIGTQVVDCAVERQVAVPIEYQGSRFDEGFRADLIVGRKVIVELKSVERITPAHYKWFSGLGSSVPRCLREKRNHRPRRSR
jgi:hypothetical protein